ncbi:MAG: hypothetical protein AAF666_17285 [Pseudomonadota bacterium]
MADGLSVTDWIGLLGAITLWLAYAFAARGIWHPVGTCYTVVSLAGAACVATWLGAGIGWGSLLADVLVAAVALTLLIQLCRVGQASGR